MKFYTAQKQVKIIFILKNTEKNYIKKLVKAT